MNIHKPDLTDFAEFSDQMARLIEGETHRWGIGSRVQCEGQWGTVVRREAHYPSKEWDDSEYTLVRFDGEPEPVITYLGDLVSVPVGDINYLEIDDWERFGEWLESGLRFGHFCLTCRTFHCADARPGEHNFTEWPPRNIVLLGRASTEMEYWKLLRDMSAFQGWREAVLLTPMEEIHLWKEVHGNEQYTPLVEQIIVQPHSAESDLYMGVGNYWPRFRDSIIRQVREIRGECEYCGGEGEYADGTKFEEQDMDGNWDTYETKRACPKCSSTPDLVTFSYDTPEGKAGTGVAPGKPLLLIEGDERYQERIEL